MFHSILVLLSDVSTYFSLRKIEEDFFKEILDLKRFQLTRDFSLRDILPKNIFTGGIFSQEEYIHRTNIKRATIGEINPRGNVRPSDKTFCKRGRKKGFSRPRSTCCVVLCID